MKIVKVETSQGSLGANKGCERAPEILAPEAQAVEIVEGNIEETNKNIENTAGDLFIGGDHSITYPLFRNFAQKYEEPALVVFDAHADCVNDFSPPSHEDFNRVLISEKTLKQQNLMIVGLRKVDAIEKQFLEQNKIKHVYFDEIKDYEKLVEDIKKFGDGKALYVSIDIDVLDPKVAPGTGYTPEGGMNLNQLLDILKKIKPLARRIDLVEINPEKDEEGKTINCAREIIDTLS